MSLTLSRRSALQKVLAGALGALPLQGAWRALRPEEFDFPLIDFHAHVEGDFKLLLALELARSRGVKLGLAEHGGCGQKMNNDAALNSYLEEMAGAAVYKGMQAEGLDWMKCFSKNAIAQLDFVLSDALTFPEKDGHLVQLWTPAATIADKQDFMERYVAFNVRVISEEPIDIFANPTFLPEAIAAEYDKLWTKERMRRVIEAAVKNGVAIEINSRYDIPSLAFLRMAKEAGVKFSFGSNAHDENVGKLDYSLQMARELGLTRKNMFMPAPRAEKPIMRRD
ncbi:MAG: hypothetical protein ABSG54_14190 [Terriglobia bacterium]